MTAARIVLAGALLAAGCNVDPCPAQQPTVSGRYRSSGSATTAASAPSAWQAIQSNAKTLNCQEKQCTLSITNADGSSTSFAFVVR